MLKLKWFIFLFFLYLGWASSWSLAQDKTAATVLNQTLTTVKPTSTPATPTVPSATPTPPVVPSTIPSEAPVVEPGGAKYEEYQSICRTNDYDLVTGYSDELKDKRIKLLKDKIIVAEKNSVKTELRLIKEYIDQNKNAEFKSMAAELKTRKLSTFDNEFLNALIAFSDNKLNSARTILSKLLVDNEENVEVLKLLAEIYVAEENYFEASAAYEDLNKLTKNSYLIQHCQTIVLNSLNADGEKFCLQAATQNPKNPFPMIFVGISQRERGDLRRAVLSFKKALALKPTEMGHTCLAEAYFIKQDFNLAIEQFKKSIELNSYSERAVLGLAWSYLKQKNYTESADVFKSACKMNGKNLVEIKKAFKELNSEKIPEAKKWMRLIETCGGG